MPPAIRKFLVLFFTCLLFHLAGTWTLPLIDRDEPRFAEAAREMLQRGDYVVPYFNNTYRFDKPPLTYWWQTASYRVFGDNDFAARLPSAVAAALTALLLFAWGKRIAGERLGFWAALIFSVSLQTVVHAKAAVADMWLVCFVTAAHWAGYELLRERLTTNPPSRVENPKSFWWLFYLSLAAAFLAKGPIGWSPLLTLVVVKFFLRDLPLQRRFLFFTGLALMLSLVALWGIPALVRTNGEFLRVGLGRHVVERSVIAMEGHGGKSIWAYLAGLPFYFVTIFYTFFPWAFALPWLLRRLWRGRDPLDNYLLAGAGVIFLLFTLVKTKLPHYTLPAFPLLALLLAKAIVDRPGALVKARRAAMGFAAFVLFLAAASIFLAPLFPSWNLYRQARGDLTREMEFGAVRYREPSLVWYFRSRIDGFMVDLDENDTAAFMARPGARFVILPTRFVDSLYPTLPPGWKSYRTQGLATVSGRRADLTLLLKRS